MRKLRIGIIDLVSKGPTRAMFARVMNANLVSIMPQVAAVWCQQEGHDVTFVCYTGFENLIEEIPLDIDLVFIGAFTEAAHLAYALSNLFRSKGAVTVLGGPHARCYPQDAQKYFDYVLGFTNKSTLQEILSDPVPHRPLGRRLSAATQPMELPSVRERWEFIEATLRKAPILKMVPMIGSLGCPYTCSFCIDSEIPYQPLDLDVLREDLRFLRSKFKRPIVAWHDPNFGIRFDEVMDAIEEAVPQDSIDFLAESSLSILSEPHLQRMKRNGFKAILPGIESWYDMGNKSKTGQRNGMKKVEQVSEHVNMILRYIPYIQTNFVLGLDCDNGAEPFELTKRFVDMSPGAFPGYSLLTAFGQAAPLNLEYQREGRVLPHPFFLLNNNHAMNVKPKNYSWPAFYDNVIDLVGHTYSKKAIYNRFKANKGAIPAWMNVVRAMSSEGWGRHKYHTEIRRRLDADRQLRNYLEHESLELPQFYHNMLRSELGTFYQWLPDGSLDHDCNAYLGSTRQEAPAPVGIDLPA